MADKPESPGKADNLEVIRQLLQKLEEAAAADADRTPVVSKSSVSKAGGLDIQGAARSPVAAPPTSATAGDPGAAGRQGKAHGRTAVAVGSFVMGVATAAALAMYAEPIKKAAHSAWETAGLGGTSRDREVAAVEAATPAVVAQKVEVAVPAEPAPAVVGVATVPAGVAPSGPAQAAPAAGTTSAVADSGRVQAASSSGPVLRRVALVGRLEGMAGVANPFPLRLQPMPTESDAQLVIVRGVPQWLTLSRGSALGNEIWLIPGHAADDLTFYVAEGGDGEARIKVELAQIDGRVVADVETTIVARKGVVPPYASAPIASLGETVSGPAVARALARADLLLDTGELSAARELYKSAAEAGNAGAALKLGETYDPGELQRLGMLAQNFADAAAARRWYELAQALGSMQAADRLTALKQR